jgi:hypothetical protein
MKVQYGNACLSLQQVHEWTRKFMNGTRSVTDSPYLVRHTTICGKGCTDFCDERGVILEHYMPRENTVNSATYADLLKNHLRSAIKSKRADFWVKVVCYNMTVLGAILPVQLLQQSKICPSSVIHIRRTRPQWLSCLWTAQEAMGGESFRSVEEMQQAVHEWMRSQPKYFFSRGIHALPKRCNTCMVRSGDYVEKWSHCVPFVFSKLRDKKIFKVFIWLTLQERGTFIHTRLSNWNNNRGK